MREHSLVKERHTLVEDRKHKHAVCINACAGTCLKIHTHSKLYAYISVNRNPRIVCGVSYQYAYSLFEGFGWQRILVVVSLYFFMVSNT
jgi:hypothetical protein